MSNPRISVIVITARPGGLDVLVTGLGQQTFRDFEVVLVDALHVRRRELVGDLFSQARIPVCHVPPRRRQFPIDACPEARNTAIAKARGELLLWLVDYTYLPVGVLREHWGVWEFSGGKQAGMGAHKYLYPPTLAYTLPDYAPMKRFRPNEEHGVTYQYDEADSRRFAADVEAGVYDSLMYSVFHPRLEDPMQIAALPEDPGFFNVDPKRHGLVGGIISGNFYHAKNESVGLAWAVEANGFDESFTGHLYDDTAFGHRVEHAGHGWMLLDPAATVSIVNPRHLFPHMVRRATTETHRAKYEAIRTDATVKVSDNPYVLGEVRQMGQWWYV